MTEPGNAMSAAGHPSRRLVLTVMCIGYFLVLLDVTIVNVALPSIESGLGAGVSGLQWVVDSYALALAALMLGGGTIGDLHGHKRVVLFGLVVFGAASLGCGLAPDTAVLVGFRIAQGVGAALMLPGTLAVITDAYPEGRDKAKAIGIWAGIGSAALPAGPLLGGLLTQAISWRAVFFLNVPFVAAAVLVAARTVPQSAHQPGRRLDWPGVLTGAGLLAVITFAFVQAGHTGTGPPVIAAIVAAGCLLVAFWLVERSRSHPMLPLALFRQPVFSAANAVAGVMNLGTLGLLFVVTLYLQDIQHYSALRAGVALFPLFLPLTLLAPAAGRLTARIGSKLPMTAGLVLAAAGTGLLATLHTSSGYLMLLPGLLLWGIGLGILTPAVVAAALGAVGDNRSGLASAVNNTARQACGAIGIAAFGAIAGQPGHPGFLPGLHMVGVITAALFLAGAITTLTLIRQPAEASQ
jgi:DHA2 family methylenomycin A resistance protein-like MFS transporter